MLLNREEMVNELRQGVVLINFTKANGDKRDLRCTLHPDYLPSLKDEVKSNRSYSNEAISVWDVENEGWRSFRLDSVNHVINPAI